MAGPKARRAKSPGRAAPRPMLHEAYTTAEALASLAAPADLPLCCGGAFAVLPRGLAWFVTLGAPPTCSAFTRPSVLAWKPAPGVRLGKHDALPARLLGKVHLFVRAGAAEPFVYAGETALIPQFRADFETVVQVAPKLPRALWERLGGARGPVVEVDGRRAVVSDDADIARVLESIRGAARCDVGVARWEEDWLHALFAGDRAFLMYLPQIGDAGRSSRDPRYAGPAKAEVVFRSSNGEDTALPARFTLPKAEGLRAVEHFLRTGDVPPFVTWEED